MILRRSRREAGPSPFGSAAAAGDGAWPSPQRRSVLRTLTKGQRASAPMRAQSSLWDGLSSNSTKVQQWTQSSKGEQEWESRHLQTTYGPSTAGVWRILSDS